MCLWWWQSEAAANTHSRTASKQVGAWSLHAALGSMAV